MGEGQKSLCLLHPTCSRKDSEIPLSFAVSDCFTSLLVTSLAPPDSSEKGTPASCSCYCETVGVCYVPEGSSSAEDLCGCVLLHHLFY